MKLTLLTKPILSIPVPAPVKLADAAPARADSRARVSRRLKAWMETLQTNPDAEAAAIDERRQRLLDHLSRAVAEASDDTPIKDVVARLNRHWDD